jgi:beta-lactamase superfamily II metal-dependent hydrolase
MATSHRNSPTAAGVRLIPPEDGVTVRMYRIGHGDCFLLALPGNTKDKPVYVLIDCGYKPGSPKYINTTAKEVCAHIRDATGGFIDIAVITHEHQDHVNGITEANFEGIKIGEAWFAWTEDPKDEDAKELRRQFKDRLALLFKARNQLAADASSAERVGRIDDFLAFELGGDDENDFTIAAVHGLLGADGVENSQNKRAMKLFKDKAGAANVKYLRPHDKAILLKDAKNVRVYPLGPPRDRKLLHSLNPEGAESFPDAKGTNAFGTAPADRYFAAAIASIGTDTFDPPFSARYRTAWRDMLLPGQDDRFWANFYGGDNVEPYWPASPEHHDDEAPSNAGWRRIDKDWLYSTEQFALDMNNDTNNGSLVLAFELAPHGKVLLFAADAQRGNWRSWTKGVWQDGERTVTTKDLLARTVLYKVGHHGSHNATLHGDSQSDYANLDWMAAGDFAGEFAAMITAVRPWAETQKGWDHPKKEIKDALLHKAAGRVFQTDTDVNKMKQLRSTDEEWQLFMDRIKGERLFIDYTIKL